MDHIEYKKILLAAKYKLLAEIVLKSSITHVLKIVDKIVDDTSSSVCLDVKDMLDLKNRLSYDLVDFIESINLSNIKDLGVI